MAIKITDLTPQDAASPLDWLMMVDREDQSMSEWGTNKKIAVYHMAQSMIDMIPSSYFLNKKITGYVPGITGEINENDTILTTFSKLKSAIDTKAPIINPRFQGTVEMPVQTTIGNVDADEISYLDGVTDPIQGQINTKAPIASPTFTGTVTLPTGSLTSIPIKFVAGPLKTETVSGAVEYDGTKFYITHNSSPTPTRRTIATETFVTNAISDLIDNAPLALDTLNELAAAINDDANYATTITTALSLKAPLASPIFSGNVVLPSTTSIGTVLSNEISCLDGVTSSIQNQLDAKAPSTGASFFGTITLPTTTSIGNVDSNEISYLNGVTSSIQAQLDLKGTADSVNGKAPINNPTFTGTVTLPTGTSAAAPLKFVSGALSTNPIAGAVEYDGAKFYITNNSGTVTRNTIAVLESPTFTGTVTAPTFSGTLNGSATSAGSTTNFTGSLSGDVTGTQTLTAISATTVTGKALTSLTTSYTVAQTVAATDSILSAIGKIVYNNTLKSNVITPVFTGSTSGNGGIAIKQNTANSSTARDGYINFTNENDKIISSINADISTNGSSTLRFSTTVAGSRTADRALEALRITPNGSIWIGTSSTASTSKLVVNGDTTTTNVFLSGTNTIKLTGSATGTDKIITFPDATGTVALTSHTHGSITSDGKLGSAANLPLITTTGGTISTGSFGTAANTFCAGNDTRLSDARTPASHTHGSITNDGKLGSAANLPLITTTGGTISTGSFGTAANTFCAGNDTRINNLHTVVNTSAATLTITEADNNEYIRCSAAGGTAITLNGSGAWTVGMTVTIRRVGGTSPAGALTLTTSNATINDNDITNILAGDTFALKCVDVTSPTNKIFDFI
jgi:hypothetical protein